MTAMSFPGVFAEEYNFTAGANNGRVQSIVTWYGNSVETTAFGYDSLNRLSSATGPGWSQGFQMDGFGNLTGVTGSASASLPVDPATNRLTVPGVTYDANGNQTKSLAGLTLNYDIENRITTNPANGNPFGYDSTNRRILDGTLDGKVWVFWAIDGSVSGRYQGAASSLW